LIGGGGPEQRREIVQRWRAADLRFVGDLTRLALAHARTVRAIFADARPANDGSRVTADPVVAPQPSLVIEASAGTTAKGVFLVENTLPRRIESPILTSAFADASGRTIRAPLRLEPDVVSLEPGEEMLITVVVDMDESVPPDARFTGRFTVPGLADTYVEAVLVRRGSPAPAGATAARPRAATQRARGGTNVASITEFVLAHPGATAAEIAEGTGIDRGAVYSAASRLVRSGRLHRVPKEGRHVGYAATQAGTNA